MLVPGPSQWNKLYSVHGAKRIGISSPSSQSRTGIDPQKGKITSIFHPPSKLCIVEVEFPETAAESLGAPFLHPDSICKVKVTLL